MSYIQFQMKCNKCEEVWDTAFGIVGNIQVAEPTTKCPFCYSKNIERVKEKDD